MSNLSPKTQRTAKDNLMDQANNLVHNARIKCIKTRVSYLECFEHFAQYYSDEWHGQKIANTSAKHIYGYAEYMKEIKHYSSSTIRCELSGIRFVHNLSGSKNRLPDNRAIGLEQRISGVIDRAWLPHEIESARVVGNKERYEHLTWHGLQYYYAQDRSKRLMAEGRKNVEKNVSENMGHHRIPVTRHYFPKMPKKYRQKK